MVSLVVYCIYKLVVLYQTSKRYYLLILGCSMMVSGEINLVNYLNNEIVVGNVQSGAGVVKRR